jgi:hypothetical protein
MAQKYFVKFSNIKFNENQSSGFVHELFRVSAVRRVPNEPEDAALPKLTSKIPIKQTQ